MNTSDALKPAPVQMYGFHNGANSPQQSALKWQESQNTAQSDLNKLAKGGKRLKSKYIRKGGSSDDTTLRARTVEVPQFPPSGPSVSPVNANSSSIVGNTTAITGLNDATNDCYATNSCTTGGAKRMRSSTNKRSKHRHSSTCKHKRSNTHKRTKHKKTTSRKHNKKSKRKLSTKRTKKY